MEVPLHAWDHKDFRQGSSGSYRHSVKAGLGRGYGSFESFLLGGWKTVTYIFINEIKYLNRFLT